MAGLLFLFLGEKSAHGLMLSFSKKSREQNKAHGFFFGVLKMRVETNIVLIGYRCSGKTSVGKIVASRLGMSFYDTDDLIIERTGRSIDDIVTTDGWDKFREIEKAVIMDASQFKNAVIATGGGVVMSWENVANLKKNGYVIWLSGNPEILAKRMEKDNAEGRSRPSLTGMGSLEELEKVLEIRVPKYFEAADVVIMTDKLTVEETARQAMEGFNCRPLKFA
jgi:shikimate kinase